MSVETDMLVGPRGVEDVRGATVESARSAVSWAAVIAGAFVAAGLSLILLSLGSGLGLASVSPWPGAGAGAGAFSVMVGIWLIIVQWVASGIGGYLTGRMRTRWSGTHTHEVFFRDTAHGFLTWAVASVVGILLLATLASVASAARPPAPGGGPQAYAVDKLLRSPRPDESPSAAVTRAEAGRILAQSAAPRGAVSEEDRNYLATVVESRTGLAPADARTRVDTTISVVRDTADKARKAGSAFAIFTSLSMLIGALIACVAAAIGGQQRDEHP
ncbi:MAG: hypothetical protein ACYC8V_01515 [Caulobacteraceae bacterium]